MPNKILIIGVDGLDRELLEKYISFLPTFRFVRDKSPDIRMVSVFPPDSDTAWASIYTGLNPAKHGIVDFVDPLERNKINKKEGEYWDLEAIKGKTFWDLASKENKRSCILFPHIAFPVWEIKGIMLNYNPKTGEINIFSDQNVFFKGDNFKLQKRLPRTKFEYKKYLNKKINQVKKEFEIANRFIQMKEWDIFFFYSSALDSIKHIFWNYCDPNDPTYPGQNQFQNVILDMYKLYDELIGKLIQGIDNDTVVLIISDHGHAMRPIKLFNLNEVLHQIGYLAVKSGNIATINNLQEKLKRSLVDIAQKFGLRPLAQTILRIFPQIKQIYVRPSSIDFNNTMAHCTDLSGLKSYNYGGIKILKENVNDISYSNLREEIITKLKDFKNTDTNEMIFKWILKREDLYQGKFISKYPDIIFELQDDYGAGWEVNVPIFTESKSHKFFPGSHRGSTPVSYILNSDSFKIIKNDIHLMDIAPTILDIIGVEYLPSQFDGKSFVEK